MKIIHGFVLVVLVSMVAVLFIRYSDILSPEDSEESDNENTEGEDSSEESDNTDNLDDGTDGEGDDQAPGSDDSDGYEPQFSGLNFELSDGTWWDFRWEKNSSSAYGGSGSSSSEGAFRLVLGESRTISGVRMYEMDVIGSTGDMEPEWQYLGVKNNILYGSESGFSAVQLFNGLTGSWQGNLFFGQVYNDDSYYFAQERSAISNHPFLSGAMLTVGEGTTDSSSHTYVPGYGYIYTGDPDMSSNKQNYYSLETGPCGYYWYFSYSDYYTQSTSRDYIGLAATSLRGDDPYIPLESEPNEPVSSDLLRIERGVPVIGRIKKGDTTGRLDTVYAGRTTYYLEAEDFYEIVLEWGGPTQESDWTYITLEYEGRGDVAMFLLEPLEAGEYALLKSGADPTAGDAKEYIGYFFDNDNTDGMPLYLAIMAGDDLLTEVTYTLTYHD